MIGAHHLLQSTLQQPPPYVRAKIFDGDFDWLLEATGDKYTDAAGTLSSSVDDAVGHVVATIGGVYFSQGTGAMQPVYREDGSSLPYLEFDLIDDRLVLSRAPRSRSVTGEIFIATKMGCHVVKWDQDYNDYELGQMLSEVQGGLVAIGLKETGFAQGEVALMTSYYGAQGALGAAWGTGFIGENERFFNGGDFITGILGPLDLSTWESTQKIFWSTAGVEEFPAEIDLSSGEDFLRTFRKLGSGGAGIATPVTVTTGVDADSLRQAFAYAKFSDLTITDTSGVRSFESAFENMPITSVLTLDFSNVTTLKNAYRGSALTTVPAGYLDDANTNDMNRMFEDCAIDQTGVDNALVSVAAMADNYSVSNGEFSIHGGTNAVPSATGLVAKSELEALGWTVEVNT
jgi:hypothetical protein